MKNKAQNHDLANEISSPRLSDNPSEEGEVKVCYFLLPNPLPLHQISPSNTIDL